MSRRGAAAYLPGIERGVFPEDVKGLIGLPHIGDVFYVDATNGSDTANNGRSQDQAFKSLYAAHNACQSNHHDVIIIAPGGVGTGTGTDESAAVSGGAWTFSKNLVYVIGNCAPTMVSQRARVLWATAGQSTSGALLTISGSGNIFKNIQLGTFVDNNILVKLTGDRNYFQNVHFAGIGDSTAGDDTAARTLWISDGDENTFDGCYIGLDTVARSTTNAEIEFSDQSQRNIFRNCFITAWADNAGHLFVLADGAQDIDRFVMFEDCIFHNATTASATAMTVAMDLHASLGGTVILFNSWLFGATDWADDFTNVKVAGGAQATNSTAGLMIQAS